MTDTEPTSLFPRLDALVETSQIHVDRPRGSEHPRIAGAVYPVDYGELSGTTGGDGVGVDVFVGSDRGAGLAGVALTCDLAKRDVEVKLLLDCTEAERDAVLTFLREVLGIGGHWVPRPPEG